MSFKLIFLVIPAPTVTNNTQPTLAIAYPRWVKDCRKGLPVLQGRVGRRKAD